ncbi:MULTISPECIES: ABC transporter permease [unclassified Treponema]|uniref:ABC transporter permease n=1 Tax=unclassified Treponema TaxID=2638727 RepID=UPI0020A4FD8A|nr:MULTISPECIES: ABC transporter permease [unclassified Treponema]UTC67445.1 ABC transporter permease [Treponema sp. OMZ 789]UTC70173.1 ABC transporter permease [Treponema sp. OMZ 790]UTC72888.1 ABC transporter permease [Treponema sp. OMZ 791]
MKAFLKITLIAIKDNFITFFLVYLCLPIIFVGYNGFLQKDNFKAETKEQAISVFLDDEDKSRLSEQLTGILNSDILKNFIKIEDEQSAKYTIKIPKGYQNSVEENKAFDILIIGKEKSSAAITALSNIIKSISSSINGNHKMTKAISASSQSQELMEKYLNIQKESAKPLGKITIHPSLHSMSSYEAYAISISIFLFFMFIMEPITLAYKKKAVGLALRISSIPKSSAYIFNAQIISIALKAFIAITIYILTFRLLKISFMGSPVLLFIYVISFSLVTGIIACSLVTFNKKEIVYSIVITIFFIFGVLSTVLFTVPNKNKIAKIFSKYNISQIITNPLRDLVTENSFGGMVSSLLIMLALGSAFYILGLLMVNFRKTKI